MSPPTHHGKVAPDGMPILLVPGALLQELLDKRLLAGPPWRTTGTSARRALPCAQFSNFLNGIMQLIQLILVMK